MKPTATAPPAREACRSCVYFRNDPAYLERALAGLASLSSGYASVLADDGICHRHQRYLGANAWCPDFRARGDERAFTT